MAGNKLLNCLKKRDLLNSDKANKSELIRLGDSYLQEDRLSDAITFFSKAEHFEGLTRLKERCVSDGDFFHYRRLIMILAESPAPEDWLRLGDNALDQGKLHFARSAYQQADQPEKLAQVEKILSLPHQDQTSAKADNS